jgi:hypothetical protein
VVNPAKSYLTGHRPEQELAPANTETQDGETA